MAIKIGIVTPAYNQGQFIGQTIESILSQEGDFYIDYTIINDGSTDNTQSVIEKYDKLLKNGKWPIKCRGISFRYKTRKNGGQPSAINEGLKMSTGDILAWMNSDDYYLPGVFEKVAKTFESDTELDFIYGDCQKIYENKKISSTFPKPRPDETLESLKARGNSFELNFFTKRILEKVGYLDESLHYCMDLDMWFRIFEKGKTAYLPVTIASFRIWSNSKTTTSQREFAKEREVIRKRYGGNIIPPHNIYRFRKKFASILNITQKKAPHFYKALKGVFYTAIDLFKYRIKR